MHRTGNLESLIETCASVTDCEELWVAALDYFRTQGIGMVAYHQANPARGSARVVTIRTDGVPDAWRCEYLGRKLYQVDPMPELAARLSHPVRWSDVRALASLTPSGKNYLADRDKAVLGEGLALQVFGPGMRNGYFSLGLDDPDAARAKSEIMSLQCAAQALHLRYCDLTPLPVNALPDLSPREREILEWMARGKSNVVISEILGLSRHTVDTIARRLFEKLAVNDRTTAAIRGLGSGLLQYHRMS